MNFLKPLLLGAILYVSAAAQQNDISFEFDYAQFGYDSVSNYVEFYYSFNQSTLTVKATDSADYLDAILKIVLVDTTSGDTAISREWRISHEIIDSTEMLNKSLVGVLSFVIPEGNYRGEFTGFDLNKTGNEESYTEYIQVIPYLNEKENPKLSDVQLASNIIQASQNESSIFYKNSLEVFPIPSALFGEIQPVLFFYSELYNLIGDESQPGYKLNTLIYNSRKEVVYNKNKIISRTIDSRVEVGSVPINKFPTDTYTFVLTLIDSAANYGVSSSKRFYVYNPTIVRTDSTTGGGGEMLSSQFGVMSEEELDDLFAKSKYISTSYEIEQFEKIKTVDGKREFLYRFWKARDKTPETPKNEFFIEYLQRAAISNERFSTISKVGWKSDRGRVYMSYGEPSEIERFPNQIDSKPYEIWHYNDIEGGVEFVFADLTGFSDYTLLHSTMRGELRDDNWARRINSF